MLSLHRWFVFCFRHFLPFSFLPFHFVRILIAFIFFNLLGKETGTYKLPGSYLLTFHLEMFPLSFTSLLPVLKWWLVGFAFSGMSRSLHSFLNFLLLFKPQALQTSRSFSSLLWHLCRNPLWAPPSSCFLQTGGFLFAVHYTFDRFLSLLSWIGTTVLWMPYSVVCR